MHAILKWLLRITAILFTLIAAGLLLGWYLVSGSLPNYEGEISLEGLDGPVTIIRDANAVPHIRARTDHDAFFALGMVQAQDRLWQMELNRRAAQGRLSALLGDRTFDVDKLVKTLNLYGYASASLEHQTDEAKLALGAFSEGVNAWIRHVNADALGRGAPEFFVFGGEISPWTPADSLAILKMMALRLTGSAAHEVRRTRTLLQLPPERISDILPDYPVPAHLSLPRPRQALAPRPPADPLLAAFGVAATPELAGASNAWAVDGSRTSSGKSLMANDPHLWLSAPGVWYLADIQGPGYAAIGGTLPGVPAVLIGRNRSIGWGLTTANVDDQDLFIEEVNPENPNEYRLPDGRWAEFEQRAIRIEIANALPRTDIVRRTRHGPVLTDNQFDVDAITPAGYVATVQWTALTAEDRSMSAAIEIMRSGSIDAAVTAAEMVVAPAQNITLADQDGIALIVAGAIPMRSPQSLSRGQVPSSGAHSENDWLGIRPASDNPRTIRPASGAVANANNRTTDAPYPDHVTFNWAYPYRIQRLQKEIVGRAFHSRDGFVALQNDSVSEMARSVLPLIAQDLWWREGTTAIGDETRRRALEMLAGWTGEMDQHGPEALIFSEWVRALTRRLAADELGPLMDDFSGIRPLFIERVYRNIDGAAIWCDVNKTPETETCKDMASVALDDALVHLMREYGSNIDGWRWGAAHVAVHRHTPFGYLGPLGIIFNIEHETSGGNYTLLRGQSTGTGPTPFRNIHAAGLRVVYDFADPDGSQMMIATGQSGHPFSRFYDHLAELWARGEMIPMSMNDQDARTGALGVVELTPARTE